MKTRFLIITGILLVSFFVVVDDSETKYAYAGCTATILSQPCFDSFSGSHLPLTQRSIMEDYARNIELNFGDWQMSDRKWDDTNTPLQLPAIICTEFVVDGVKHYRMAKWVDTYRISSFEDHRNDLLCNKWLAPIDDGIKIKWDKPRYLSNDVGIVTVTDKESNLDNKKLDSFDIHMWSDTDHTGIKLTVTETEIDSGIFEGTVFLTTEGKSEGTRLLVEDTVWAEHKSNVNFSKIIDESEEPYDDPDNLCPSGKVFDWDVCVDKCPTGKIANNGVCYGVEDITGIGIFGLVLIFVAVIASAMVGFVIWRIRK